MVLQWSDQLKIGNELLDAQHRELFTLANEVLAAQTPGLRALHLMNFYLSAREHFSLEEFLMKDVSFPEIEAHTEVHAQILERLNEIRDRASDPAVAQEQLERLLSKWLLNHISESDLQLANHLLKIKNNT